MQLSKHFLLILVESVKVFPSTLMVPNLKLRLRLILINRTFNTVLLLALSITIYFIRVV